MKRKDGGEEEFDVKKVYASIYELCAHTGKTEDECTEIADTVSSIVEGIVSDREHVMSVEIRLWATEALKEIDETLAKKYYSHRFPED